MRRRRIVVPTGRNLLDRAARLLEKQGQCRGALINANRCLCPLGAIALAAGIAVETLYAWEEDAATENTPPVYLMLRGMPEVAHLADHLIRVLGVEEAPTTVETVWRWSDTEPNPLNIVATLDETSASYGQVPA